MKLIALSSLLSSQPSGSLSQENHSLDSALLPWDTLAAHLASQGRVLLPQDGAQTDDMNPEERDRRQASAVTLTTHWLSLGYTFTKRDLELLCELPEAFHAWLHEHTSPTLKRVKGLHRHHRLMYPGFPKEVMDKDLAELYFNAMMHYVGDAFGLSILPPTTPSTQPVRPLSKTSQQSTATLLTGVSVDGALDYLRTLLVANTVWNPEQVTLVRAIYPFVRWVLASQPLSIPQRENKAIVMALDWRYAQEHRAPLLDWTQLRPLDLIRATQVYSGGSPEIRPGQPKVKTRSMPRSLRRAILGWVNAALKDQPEDALSEMFQHRLSFLRLAESLHVGELRGRHTMADGAFERLRRNDAPTSWEGFLDKALDPTHAKKLLTPGEHPVKDRLTQLMESNPGKGGRALHRVLRSVSHDTQLTLAKTFSDQAYRLSTPLLLSIEAVFKAEMGHPKRDRAALKRGSDPLHAMPALNTLPLEIVSKVTQGCRTALRQRFAALPSLGKVYIEPGLEDVLLPKGLRDASEGAGQVTRGSWLPVNAEAQVIRLFLWWKHSADVDLSAVGFDEQLRSTETCNFHNLKNTGMVHSGDFVASSGVSGVAEYIDVQLDHLHRNTRYIALAANVFSGPSFHQLEECFVGWQERDSAERGQVFEPSKVRHKFQVTASSKGYLGALFDVREKRFLFLDFPMRTANGRSILADAGTIRDIVAHVSVYASSQPKVMDLLAHHLAARHGVRVETASEADCVITLAPSELLAHQTGLAISRPEELAGTWMTNEGMGDVSLASQDHETRALTQEAALVLIQTDAARVRLRQPK